MFGSLIGGKFSNKCKYSVKCIKCRMETIRKKQQAMVRYLKKDVADLIACGHDANAYGRMDALIVEINKSSCYDMIEQYCCCILEHLPAMKKDRVCPEETTEAIATLIFAAARFSGLPELTDLRRQFTNRYGTHMEAYINEEFVEKMQKKSFSKDNKLQLMQHIAEDFSIHWDFKAFQYKLSNPSAPTIDQPKIHFSSNNENNQQSHIFHGRREATDGTNKVLNWGKPVNSEVVKEDQKTIQMDNYVYRSRSAVQKELVADELESVQSQQFNKKLHVTVKTNGNQIGNYAKDWNCEGNTRKISESVSEETGSDCTEWQGAASMISSNTKAVNIPPPYTKFSGDLNGTSSNHDDFAHSTAYNIQGSRPDRRVNHEINRPLNLKPPYIKPKAPRSQTETGYFEPTIGGAVDVAFYLKNAPFSMRKRLEWANAPISEPTINDGHITMSRQSKQSEDAIDPHMHQTFSDQLKHGCTQSLEDCGKEEETVGDPLMYYRNRKGRARTRESSVQSTVDSALLAEPTDPVETMVMRPIRVSSMQKDHRMPSKLLPDQENLATRFASLTKL